MACLQTHAWCLCYSDSFLEKARNLMPDLLPTDLVLEQVYQDIIKINYAFTIHL